MSREPCSKGVYKLAGEIQLKHVTKLLLIHYVHIALGAKIK